MPKIPTPEEYNNSLGTTPPSPDEYLKKKDDTQSLGQESISKDQGSTPQSTSTQGLGFKNDFVGTPEKQPTYEPKSMFDDLSQDHPKTPVQPTLPKNTLTLIDPDGKLTSKEKIGAQQDAFNKLYIDKKSQLDQNFDAKFDTDVNNGLFNKDEKYLIKGALWPAMDKMDLIKPIQSAEKSHGILDYAGGTVKSLYNAFSDTFKDTQKYLDHMDDALGSVPGFMWSVMNNSNPDHLKKSIDQMMYAITPGEEQKKVGELVDEDKAKVRKEAPLNQVANWFENSGKSFKDMPDNLVGSMITGGTQIAPLWAELALTPEVKLSIGGANVMSQLGTLLAVKGYIKGADESKKDTYIGHEMDAFKGMGLRYAEGTFMYSLGLGSGSFGDIVGKITKNQVLDKAAAATLNGIGFSTYGTSMQYAKTGVIDKKQMFSDLGLGIMLGATDIAKAARERAVNNLFNTSDKAIQVSNLIDKSPEELRTISNDLHDKAFKIDDPDERGQILSTKNAIDNVIGLQAATKDIIDNADTYKEIINRNKDLPKEKETQLLDKIDNTIAQNKPILDQKTKNIEESLPEEVKINGQILTGDMLDDYKDMVANHGEERAKELMKDFMGSGAEHHDQIDPKLSQEEKLKLYQGEAKYNPDEAKEKYAKTEVGKGLEGTTSTVNKPKEFKVTRVEGLGMGQSQAEGTYYSTEAKNRYGEPNVARKLNITVDKPIEFDQNKDEFDELDFEGATKPEKVTILKDKLLEAKKKRQSKIAEFNSRKGLFGDTKKEIEGKVLFDQPTDLSQESLNKFIAPEDNIVNRLTDQINNLESTKETKVKESEGQQKIKDNAKTTTKTVGTPSNEKVRNEEQQGIKKANLGKEENPPTGGGRELTLENSHSIEDLQSLVSKRNTLDNPDDIPMKEISKKMEIARKNGWFENSDLPPEKTVSINSIPGISQITRMLSNTKLVKELNKIFVPYSHGEGRKSGDILRGNLGDMTRSFDQVENSLLQAKRGFNKANKEDNIDFYDRMERGEKQPTPEMQKIADSIREIEDSDLKDVQNLGTGRLENFIENYMPHIWDNPEKAGDVIKKMMGKRPMAGSKSFLKKRSIMTQKEGIDAGLTPVSYNPIDLVMLKHREVQRYAMAVNTMHELQGQGIVKFIKGTDVPEGYKRINDGIADVYSKNDKGEFVLRGRYFAQEDAARIINNYLSPGLRGNYFYDLYRGAGNSLNQFQLGFSAFHLGFTSMDATVSKFAVGLNKLTRGNITGGLKELAKSPLAPVTNYLEGRKIFNAWMGKGNSEISNILADAYALGGGRAKMDNFYATNATDAFRKSIQEHKYLKTIYKAPFALVEQMSKPIMENIVPRQKMGVFADLMKMEIESNPDMTHEELRAKASKIVDSVDNRMGQLVYDNLFWNKTVKDLAMASVRSLGWNIGTIRELGGGVKDTGKLFNDLSDGKKPDFTYRMAYMAALPIVAGLYGALYQYLRTGKPPEDLKDYYFPKTGGIDKNGDPARVSLPTYMKDIYHYTQAPGQTIKNKFNPINNVIIEMLNNKDYFGTEIRHQDDPFIKQVIQEMGYVGTQFEPFGIRNLNKDTRKGVTSKIEPFIGITPAPYDINMTPAEKKAMEIAKNKMPIGSRTKTQAEHSKKKAELRNKYLIEKDPSILNKAVKSGTISNKEKQNLIKDSKIPPLKRETKNFSFEEVSSLWDEANEEEKKELKPIIHDKFFRMDRSDPERFKKAKEKWDQINKGEPKKSQLELYRERIKNANKN